MKEAVSGILIFEKKIFCVVRNYNLSAFPGYTAFPGGKVDPCDFAQNKEKNNVISNVISNVIKEDSLDEGSKNQTYLNALKRELKEELDFDFNDHNVLSYNLISTAITPSFNPYRFKTLFFKIHLKQLPILKIEMREAASFRWVSPKDLLNEYKKGQILIVPPMKKMLNNLCEDLNSKNIVDVSLSYNEQTQVPFIEPLQNFYQLMPLSKTFPPARRTNCFIIGDQKDDSSPRLLIDPSPQDDDELRKLLKVATQLKFNHIFLTHHHPDHHQYAPDIARKFQLPIMLSKLTKQFLEKKYGDHYLENIELMICKENDVVCRYLDEDVYVVEVPGHDNGQLALTIKSKKWFIVGDLIQTFGTVVVGGTEASMSKYFNSLKKVIQFNPQFIFPSHGIGVGGVNKLRKTLKHREIREEKIKLLLKEGKSEAEMMGIIYKGIEERLKKYALATLKSHLEKIQIEQNS